MFEKVINSWFSHGKGIDSLPRNDITPINPDLTLMTLPVFEANP